jgi:hypothetical protein
VWGGGNPHEFCEIGVKDRRELGEGNSFWRSTSGGER